MVILFPFLEYYEQYCYMSLLACYNVTNDLILLQKAFNSSIYFLASVLWTYLFSVYAQVSSKPSFENFKSPIIGNMNFVTA